MIKYPGCYNGVRDNLALNFVEPFPLSKELFSFNLCIFQTSLRGGGFPEHPKKYNALIWKITVESGVWEVFFYKLHTCYAIITLKLTICLYTEWKGIFLILYFSSVTKVPAKKKYIYIYIYIFFFWGGGWVGVDQTYFLKQKEEKELNLNWLVD